jgi:hypothetical protein
MDSSLNHNTAQADNISPDINNVTSDDDNVQDNIINDTPAPFVPHSAKNQSLTTSHSPFDPSFTPENFELQVRLMNIDGLHPDNVPLTQPAVERMVFANSECVRMTWNENLQHGIAYFPLAKHASDFLTRAPPGLTVLKYRHVNHPNTYFTFVVTPLPEGWHVTDVIDFLNQLCRKEGPPCNFISGKQYENKSPSSRHFYCFVMADNRDAVELLFTKSPLRVPAPPGHPSFVLHVERAPDRRDSVNTFKLTGLPYFMTELALKQLLAHHACIHVSDIDHIYRPRNHVTGEVADYGYGKALTVDSYDRIIELSFRVISHMGYDIYVHDLTVEKRTKNKQQREQQVTTPYRPQANESVTPSQRRPSPHNNNNNYRSAQNNVIVPSSYADIARSPYVAATPALTPTYSPSSTQRAAVAVTANTTTCTTTTAANTAFAPQSAAPVPQAANPDADPNNTLLRILASIDSIKKDLRAEIEQLRDEIFDQEPVSSVPPVYISDTPMSDAATHLPQDDEMTLNKKQKTKD